MRLLLAQPGIHGRRRRSRSRSASAPTPRSSGWPTPRCSVRCGRRARRELYVLQVVERVSRLREYAGEPSSSTASPASSDGRLNAAATDAPDLIERGFVSGNYFGVLGVPPAAGPRADRGRRRAEAAIVGVLGYRVVARTLRRRSGGRRQDDSGQRRAGHDRRRRRAGFPRHEPAERAEAVSAADGDAAACRRAFFARPGDARRTATSSGSTSSPGCAGVTPQAAAAAIEARLPPASPAPARGEPEPIELTPLRSARARAAPAPPACHASSQLLGASSRSRCSSAAPTSPTCSVARGGATARDRRCGWRSARRRGRIARQLLIESLVLAGHRRRCRARTSRRWTAAARALPAAGRHRDRRARPGIERRRPRVHGAVVAGVTGVLFGAGAGMARGARGRARIAPRESRATRARSGLRSTLVAAQVALSVVLLAGTGLFLQKPASQSLRVPLGFTRRRRGDGLGESRRRRDTISRAPRRSTTKRSSACAGIPGVTAAAWTTVVPINGDAVMSRPTSRATNPGAGEDVHVLQRRRRPEYFGGRHAPASRPRRSPSRHGARRPWSAIVNETAARRFWAGRDPLQGRLAAGRTITGSRSSAWSRTRRSSELDEAAEPFVYMPFAQAGSAATVSCRRTCWSGRPATSKRCSARLREQLRGGRSRRAGLRRQHVRVARPRARHAAADGRDAVRRLRRARADARRDRHLRRRVIRRRAADARDRHPHRARRRPRARSARSSCAQGIGPDRRGHRRRPCSSPPRQPLAAAFLRGVPPRDPVTYVPARRGDRCSRAWIAPRRHWIPAARGAPRRSSPRAARCAGRQSALHGDVSQFDDCAANPDLWPPETVVPLQNVAAPMSARCGSSGWTSPASSRPARRRRRPARRARSTSTARPPSRTARSRWATRSTSPGRFGRRQKVIVRGLAEKHMPKAEARLLYEDVTPEAVPGGGRTAADGAPGGAVHASAGFGRPDKRERKALNR